MNETLSTINLVKHYFNICNTALVRHRNDLVFRPVVAVLNRLASGETIGLTVVDVSDAPAGFFATRFFDGQFTPVMEGTPDELDARFILRRDFLEEVVRNADDYIRHPEKLDWSWLV